MQVLRGIYRSRRSRHKDPGRYPLVFQDIHHHYCPGHGGALGSAAYLVAATHLTGLEDRADGCNRGVELDVAAADHRVHQHPARLLPDTE